METQLYSFTRFLCLCSRELAIALNYYAVCKKVWGKLGQSSSPEHSHSAPRHSTEGSALVNIRLKALLSSVGFRKTYDVTLASKFHV